MRATTQAFSFVLAAALLAGCVAPPDELPPARVGEQPPPVRSVPSRPRAYPPAGVQYPAPPGPSLEFREALALQALLDRHNLSCGAADGVIGSRTRIALRAWQERNGLPVTGLPDDATRASLGSADAAFTTHVVTEQDHLSLTPVPKTWAGKAKVARLGYQTILEQAAEQYHAAESAIRKLNPAASWPNPPAGASLIVPDPSSYDVPSAGRITISLGEKTFRVYDSKDQLIALFPCSIAADHSKRPRGELRVVTAARDPNYYFDPELFTEDPEASTLPGRLVIPPGPNNPVGVAWISLNLPGYGMHGTPHPEDIGKTESHGCFRLCNWNAEKLLRMVAAGTPVVVTD